MGAMDWIGSFVAGVAIGCLSPVLWITNNGAGAAQEWKYQQQRPFNSPPLGANMLSLFLLHDEVVELGAGRRIKLDDILLGDNILFDQANLFKAVRWKGMNVLQTPNDMLAMHSFLWEERPDLLIEFGTNTGGSAVFLAESMLAVNPNAHVITIDPVDSINEDHSYSIPIEVKASSSPLWGTTIRPIIGWPTSPAVKEQVSSLVSEFKPQKVVLFEDSNHEYSDVVRNLLAYEGHLRPCDWIIVHDMKMARLYNLTGPLRATRDFLRRYPDYKVNRKYEFLVSTEMPQGWLQKGPLQRCTGQGQKAGTRTCNYGASVRDQLCMTQGETEPKIWLVKPPTA